VKHITLFSLQALLIALIALGVGCVRFPEGFETEADFTGHITQIERIGRGGTLGQVLVQARVVREGTDYVDKYMATVKDETLIFEGDGGDRRPTTFEALVLGQQMQMWFSGPVKESYPAQVDAQQIVILPFL
jgi:hypothetical protein